ncbi:aldehyde ferredoxin oxidoreductase family protein [Hyperthermus butylicus]|uniref:Tungsten-containing aldehyde ferredoxin oxidoreductase n=1 Tax=Hyperthermus butylicus (strain DSM 5456 / JCM 9403 / PLM1-5) TaxID=415426 RepID=A2BLI7_HYPBU|nr:aldehyde ferredoxin oxidoreductase family protein [Hyperthermus butylicus]ABM80848.1 Tungsten-containing aldehyde ferredoxin oxidoreductase [Hyperthermus butylicus DSM 5456]
MEFKLLRINLWTQKVREEKIDERTLRRFLGGRGLGAYLALKEIPKGADPLGPENKLYILTGPLTGTAAVETGRYHVVGKSPLTGILGDSNSGGQFGPWLRFSGYDGIVLESVSEEPVWISIIDGEVKFHDARDLWGRGVIYTEKKIRDRVGITKPDLGSVLSIGPAGENLSKIAAIMNDKYRAAGRTGLGAVMGSKRVKAIFVYGHRRIELYDRQKFLEAAKKLSKAIVEHSISQSLTKYGTAVLVNIINEHGGLPTKNWTRGVFEKAQQISGEYLAEHYLKTNKGCWGCAIRCSRVAEVKSGPYRTPVSEGPEYETIWANGANTMIGNMEAIIKINYLLNDMGLDTISFGNTAATLMELYEKAQKGELPEDKAKKLLDLLEDVEPTWGNADAVIRLIWKTAYRDGIGDYTAEGAARLAEEFGCPDCAIHVRGLELPAYDPRAINSMALSYATSNRGGCHLRAYGVSFDVLGVPKKFDPLKIDLEKVKLIKWQQDYFAVIDSLVVCKFNTFADAPEYYVELLKYAMGWEDLTVEELLTIGERIYNVERLFAVREGRGYRDYLPKRLLEEPLPDGPAKGRTAKEALETYLPEYYKLRGWVDGKPTPETLKRLGLGEFLYIVA